MSSLRKYAEFRKRPRRLNIVRTICHLGSPATLQVTSTPRGTIRWNGCSDELGFIAIDHRNGLTVQFDATQKVNRTFRDGQRVTFTVEQRAGRLQARDIRASNEMDDPSSWEKKMDLERMQGVDLKQDSWDVEATYDPALEQTMNLGRFLLRGRQVIP